MDYSSTEHLDNAIKHIQQKYPNAPIYIVGFSMGAIQGLKWLGENKGKPKHVKGMVSISCPVSLAAASPRLSEFRHYIYAEHMTKSLIKLAVFHKDLIEKKGFQVDYGNYTSELRGCHEMQVSCRIRHCVQLQSLGIQRC